MAEITGTPWETPFTELPRSRILVIYNTDVAWVQGVCEYYCQQRGIPAANLMGVPMGTTHYYYGHSPDYNIVPAEFDALLYGVAAKLQTGLYSAILFGPRTPSEIIVRGFDDNYGGLGTGNIEWSTQANLSFGGLLSAARVFIANRIPGTRLGAVDKMMYQEVEANQSPKTIPAVPLFSDNLTPSEYMYYEYDALESGPLQYLTTTSSASISPIRFPNPTAAQRIERNTKTVWAVHYGYIGWNPGFHSGASGTATPEETEVAVRNLIDRATVAIKAQNRVTNMAKPHLMGLHYAGSHALSDGQAYYRQLVEWGVNVSYYYAFFSDPGGSNNPPYASAWANGNQLTAGMGTPFSYFCLLGGSRNSTDNSQDPDWYANASLPYDGNHVAQAGGHCMMMGPSYPYLHNALAVGQGPAVAGLTANIHQGGQGSLWAYGFHACLLQGMSYLEAAMWVRPTEQGVLVPMGDPLYAPYGRPRFAITGTVSDASAPVQTDPVLTFATKSTEETAKFIESAPCIITGGPGPFKVSTTTNCQWSVTGNENDWHHVSGTVYPGQALRVRVKSSSTLGTSVVATVYVGGASATYTCQTAVGTDSTPAQFDFQSRSGVAIGQLTTSLGVFVDGFNAPTTISISAGSEWNIASTDLTTWSSVAGTLYPTSPLVIRVRHTASALPLTPTTTVLTIGGIQGTYTTTTGAV